MLKIFSNINRALLRPTKRYLNLQEYQSKQIMQENGVNVQRFILASDIGYVRDKIKTFICSEYVIKAQILAGGRGKGVFSNGFKGGVVLSRQADEVENLVSNMLGHRLITKQTPETGVPVQKVMIAEAIDIARETYLAILLDGEFVGPVLIGSPCGGMDIEEISQSRPDALLRINIDPEEGILRPQAEAMARHLEFKGDLLLAAAEQIERLYGIFAKSDLLQIEINPFGETDDGRVVCYDAKLTFDDNASFRQREMFALHDNSEDDPREIEAGKHHLNYVGLSGNIGCLVNGAGLAMATMDIVKLCGGEPANFLDIGGGVEKKQVEAAFRILASDSTVKCILVNIFGGIVNCEIVAKGIISACQNLDLKIPLVVRLEGNNVDAAKDTLQKSKVNIIAADTLGDAAEKAVKCLSE